MPRPNVKVLGKPLETDVEITAPRIRMETITSSLVYFVNKVSYAFHLQDEDITPLFSNVFGPSSPNPLQIYQ